MLWSCRSFRYRAVIAAILNFHKKTNLQGGDIVNLKIIFLNARRIKSFFQIAWIGNRSQMSNVVYKASCWNWEDFYMLGVEAE